MDDRQFDRFVQTIGRRGLLGAALALVGAASTRDAAAQSIPFCSKKNAGDRCRRGTECCSGRCKRKKKNKKGHCRCGALLTSCENNNDCCGNTSPEPGSIVCSDKVGFDEAVCCVSRDGQCQGNADCCGDLACKDGFCIVE